MVLTALFRALKVSNGTDITRQSDYFADIGDPGVQAVSPRRSRSTELWQTVVLVPAAREFGHAWQRHGLHATTKEFEMGKGGRKRRARRKKSANHGKRPNA